MTKKDKRRLGRLSRNKGAAFERFVAHKLLAVYPHARRGLGQARAGGEVPDVDGTPLWVQCKHERCPNVFAALAQGRLDLANTRDPVKYPGGVIVVARRNQSAPGVSAPDVVVLPLDDYVQLLREVEAGRVRTSEQRTEVLEIPRGDGYVTRFVRNP